MKRTLALIFVLVMCLGLFVGCGSDGEANKESGGATSTASTENNAGNSGSDGIFSLADVVYKNGDNSVYRFVRPEGDVESNNKAVWLMKQFKAAGINFKNVSDLEDGTDTYEILVGRTNRPETQQAREYLIANAGGRVNDYIICTIGKKIVIYGMSKEALDAACTYFAENCIKAEGVKGGIKKMFVTEGDFVDATVNGAKLGNFVFVKQRYNESYLTQQQMEATNTVLTEKAGYCLDIVEDHNEASDYEIIIGNANREGATSAASKDEYSIKIAGKKVYLNGGSPAAKALAISEFEKLLLAGDVTDAMSVTGSYSATVASYDTSTYFRPTWTDDFDEAVGDHETGIDLTKWAWGTDASPGHNGRMSVRSQSSEHLGVYDGMLNFCAAYDESNYYGFKLLTKNKMTFRYGILEMSAILPDSGNKGGFWISLWANSYDPGNSAAFMTEVNVVEMFGNSASEASNLHGWSKGDAASKTYYSEYWAPQGVAEHWSLDGSFSGDKRYECQGSKFNNELHTFTYIWEEDLCAFACDGNLYFSINPNEKELWQETFNQPIYLILSMATCFEQQASCPADDDPVWLESNNFQIDYVHIYQKENGKHALNYFS